MHQYTVEHFAGLSSADQKLGEYTCEAESLQAAIAQHVTVRVERRGDYDTMYMIHPDHTCSAIYRA